MSQDSINVSIMSIYSLKPRIFRIKFKNISEDYIYNKPIIIAIIKIIIVVQESLFCILCTFTISNNLAYFSYF